MTADVDASRKALMLALYDCAVAMAHPSQCVPGNLPPVPDRGHIIVVGAGKANAAMAVATERHYAARGDMGRVSGFVTTRHGFKLPSVHLEIVEAAHPVPDAMSAAAAERTLTLARTAGPDDLVLALMSGGASALWTAPVAGVGFDEKQVLTKHLLRSGARISEMNTVRRHLSRIKGGRLAAGAFPARMLTLAISDVPGDDPAAIGSGPTVADPTTLTDARDILARYGITPSPGIAAALADPANETVKPGARELANAEYRIIAAPKASLEAAARLVERQGYRATILGDSLEGEARDAGRAHARLALDARRRGEKCAILSGGEFTVTVTGTGSGGPNQEYALGLALELNEAPGITALAADTDGIDGGGGNSIDPAGALVLSDTLSRARSRHIDAAKYLLNNDSTAFFRAVDGLVQKGPTQTNVNDFRVILVDP